MGTDSLRQIGTILVATGLTPESTGGLLMGADLASRMGAALHVVHVVEPASAVAEKAIPGLAEKHVVQAREDLQAFCSTHGVTAASELHVLRGDPEAEILRLRASLRADLLVVGRYGKGGLKRGRLGSIANRLIRKCQVSVLIAQPEFRGPVRRVGVACDFHEDQQPELRRGLELAQVFGTGEVHVLSSYEVPAGYHTVMGWDEACEKMEAAMREAAERDLRVAASGIADAPEWRVRLEEGSPSSRVPAMAQEEHLDLLVLGTHTRSRIAMKLLGRTSEKIVDAAGCSVWAERDAKRFQGFVEMLKEWAE